MFPAEAPTTAEGGRGEELAAGQVLGCLLVSAGASEQEAQQEEVGNNAALPTVSYRLPRLAGTGMRKRSQAKF